MGVYGGKWQPMGDQFSVACMVCRNEDTIKCEKCLREVEPGFEFSPDRYILMCQRSMEEKHRLIGGARGSGKVLHLEQMLARVTEDRNCWRRLAESAIQHIKVMAEREIK